MIDGRTISVAPVNNLSDPNGIIDVKATCERTDTEKVLFLDSHSPFSNLHLTQFNIEGTTYNCCEQFIQGEKARIFNDDISHAKIMRESNPYKIKKLGNKIKGFNHQQWRRHCKSIAYKVNLAKYTQNKTLQGILLNSGTKLIAEGSNDPYWGIGVHLHEKSALDRRHWPNNSRGVMSEILSQIRNELTQ